MVDFHGIVFIGLASHLPKGGKSPVNKNTTILQISTGSHVFVNEIEIGRISLHRRSWRLSSLLGGGRGSDGTGHCKPIKNPAVKHSRVSHLNRQLREAGTSQRSYRNYFAAALGNYFAAA